ncbi:MAG: ABC transporter substrate-binding protein [Actinomycetota bacterium]|nr:ABC transporter substrate-binding protein [Actinomycetota bacterium]
MSLTACLFGACLAIVLVGCGSSSSSSASGGSSKGGLNIVVFEGFSGANASFGPESMDPCLAAASLINADGGVLGHTVSCVAADSRGDPADAVLAAGKVVATGHPVLVLGPETNTAPPTVPIFNSAHIPMFSSTGSSEFDRQTQYPYFWRLLPPDKDTGYALAIGAHDNGITRIASVFGDAATNQTNVAPLAAGFRHLGGNVVASVNLASGQGSYNTEAARVAAAHPQVIATEADPQTDATFLSELQQQLSGKLPPIYGTSATQQPTWLSAVGKAIGAKKLASLQLVAVPYAPFSGPVYDAFKKALLATHTSNPVQFSTDIFSLAAFDAVNIASLCMIQTKSTTPSVYNGCIMKLTNPNPSATAVHTFAEGKAALQQGKTIRYVGVIGAIVLNQYHSSPGEFAIVKYTSAGANGTVAVQRLIPTSEIAALVSRLG